MPNQERIGGGFTEGELQFASFWVRNRMLLRKVGHSLLLGANVLMWGYVAWSLLDAFVISYPRESRITADIARNQFLAAQLAEDRPQTIQTGGVSVFLATEDRLDFLTPIMNANDDWWVDFTYRFNVSGELTPQRSGFILPGQKSYLGEFGFAPKTKGARNGVLVVDNIHWHRLDRSVVGADYPAWVERRNPMSADNATFTPDLIIGTKRLSRTAFTLNNPSAYGFWHVPLYVVLKRGDSPVAATMITIDRVNPGEKREVAIDWFETLPTITDTEVVPVVNYLDAGAYLPSTQIGG